MLGILQVARYIGLMFATKPVYLGTGPRYAAGYDSEMWRGR